MKDVPGEMWTPGGNPGSH